MGQSRPGAASVASLSRAPQATTQVQATPLAGEPQQEAALQRCRAQSHAACCSILPCNSLLLVLHSHPQHRLCCRLAPPQQVVQRHAERANLQAHGRMAAGCQQLPEPESQ